MRSLFDFDFHDYDPNGSVFVRNSVRAIIRKDDKVLLAYSTVKGYYQFPGGGIEDGETHEQALIREVKEETGYTVIPDSIMEFGHVLRRNKDLDIENAIFEQDNFYYFCEVEDTPGETSYVDYEITDGYTPVWIAPFEASKVNHYNNPSDKDRFLVRRDEKVLDLVDLEFRRLNRIKNEDEFFEALGDPAYKEMVAFVHNELGEENTENISAKKDINYSRFSHTKRVLQWAKRLYDLNPAKDELRYEDLIIATIFHDVGRSISKKINIPHAQAGVPITQKYLSEKGFSKERIDFITMLVGKHSDKHLMNEPDIDNNLLLLMEADLLDDMGALGIVMDCMIVTHNNPDAVFTDCLDHITRFTKRIQQKNPMVTKEGRALWDEKTKLVDTFVDALKKDVDMEA